jgi:hypothetical protein
MSIPSSSASVAETPSRSPSTRRRSVGSQPRPGCCVHAVDGELVNQLCRAAALREADRSQPARNEVGHQARCLAERACAQAQLSVEELGIPQGDRSLGAWRGIPVDDRGIDSPESGGELARVGDRRGGEQQLRLGTVDAGEAAEAAQDVRDVRAEHAAIHVCLVDDDEAQVVEDVRPAVVVREHADVEHVRVREDQVRPAADLPTAFPWRVPVVDRRAHVRRAELTERPRLVLGQGLRRVEVERAVPRLARDCVEHWEVERERLS